MTKKFRVSVIVVYTPVEPTDGDTIDSDKFYLQLQEQLDLSCLSNVKCCGNLCPASPNKVLREQHFGFVSLLSVKR